MNKVLEFIVKKKESYRAERVDLKNDYKTANKLGFNVETVRIERDISNVSEILEVLEEVAIQVQKKGHLLKPKFHNPKVLFTKLQVMAK